MSRRWLINYVLFILIIVFTWIGANYPIRDDQKIDQNRLTNLNPEDIKHIKIELVDESITLEKQGSNWQIIHPINWFANNIAAERLATLASIEPQSKLAMSQIDLSTLGLRIPKAVVSLDDKSIFFGDINQIGNRRYVLLDPNVYLISDIHHAFVSQGISGLIDNRLLPSKQEITRLSFKGFELSKTGNGWESTKPNGDSKRNKQLVSNWQSLQASKISTYDNSLTPSQKVVVTNDNDKNIEFYVLAIQPELIIAHPDLNLQYHFAEKHYYDLLSFGEPTN